MTEKRFECYDLIFDGFIKDTFTNENIVEPIKLIHLLNEQQSTIQSLKEENMDLRANHTQMIIIMKDVVRDLKRMDTYRYAEHLEKIANLHFLSEKELEDD